MRFILIILGCFVSSYVLATDSIYKCIDNAGKKGYQSGFCGEGKTNTTLNIKTGSSTNLDEQQQKQELKKQAEQVKLEEKKLTKQQQIDQQDRVNKEAIAESEKNRLFIKENPKKFSAFAIPPYVPGKLSELVKNYQGRLADIERLRRTAAEKALSTNQCGRVEASELDTKSTKIVLSFLINCSSGKTFYYTELDLKK